MESVCLPGNQDTPSLTGVPGCERLKRNADTSGRLFRWFEKLGQYQFKIKYNPGKETVVAVELSRNFAEEEIIGIQSQPVVRYNSLEEEDDINNEDLGLILQNSKWIQNGK